MEDHERDFLIAEYEQSWAMILNIDERRFKFVEHASAIFTALLAVSATLVTWHGTLDTTIAAPITVLLACGALIGRTFELMIRSERESNVRYRKKINLLREIFLQRTTDPILQDYVSSYEALGIKTFHGGHTQPEGIGKTLTGVLLILRIEVVALAASIPLLWIVALLND